ncbi:MAG: hypothetical protein ACRC3Y_15900 [Romboutsia sp.]|uniref:hypothetical protein n=1 Tax=Romboutsia sp. TaxID=1965302 RepID=UPI003F2EC582
MFRMNGINRKKASKEKKVESKQKYQEDFNEIILNDLVPEEKKEEFGLNSVEDIKPKKSGRVKLNFGLGGKKSASKSKQSPSKSKGPSDKTTKQHKKSDKNDNALEESSKGKKGTNKKQSSSPSKENNSKSKNGNKNTPSKESNKKSSKGKTTKKTKSLNPSQSNIEEIQDIIVSPIEEIGNKKSIGPKKKRVKNSNKQVENENKRNIDENEENYEVKDNFDCVNFRTSETSEHLEGLEGASKKDEVEFEKEVVIEEKPRNRFENLVWSEDKFPQK